jgi:hypothetical protein
MNVWDIDPSSSVDFLGFPNLLQCRKLATSDLNFEQKNFFYQERQTVQIFGRPRLKGWDRRTAGESGESIHALRYKEKEPRAILNFTAWTFSPRSQGGCPL